MHLTLSASAYAQVDGGARIALAPRDAALLAWLALEGPTPRARLAALLWPDSDADAARNALRQRLFQLRKQFGVELVAGSTTLALADGVTHDLEQADQVLGDGPAVAAGEFADWLAQQRRRRQTRLRQSLVEIAQIAETAGDWADALAHAQELLALDPLSEDAHRRLIRLHYLAGDRAAALLAFDRCEQVLKDEIGVRPSAETLALLATIEAGTIAAPAVGGALPASVLRPPRMIGRDRELAALARGWASGEVVAVIGEAGLGKTRLLQTFIDGHPGVVRAAGRPGDAGVPFATLARLLRAVLALGGEGTGGALAVPSRSEIARVLPEFDGGSHRPAGEGQRLVLQRALRGLLGSQPRLAGLVVDDLHFADEASLEMLGALIDGGDDEDEADIRWCWALAYRPADAGSPVQALHDGLVEQARLAPLPLAPLDEAALAELVDSLGLPGVDGIALAPGLRQRTGGNPLFVLETLKQAWVDRTLWALADSRSLPRPVSIGRLIERRVAQLSPGALALARVASIAGVDFGIALAAHVLQVPAMRLADVVGELESAQVLRGNAFAHDLVADAVGDSIPVSVARHTHAQVARWLEDHGGEAARIAGHWIEAGQPVLALPALQAAADAARLALRFREYVDFLDAKSRIEEADGRAKAAFDSLLLAAQEAVTCGSDATADGDLLQRLGRLASNPMQQVQWLHLRATTCAQRGDGAAAVEIGQRALEAATALGDERLVMACHYALSGGHTVASHFAESARHMRLCLAWFDAHGTDDDRASVHDGLAMALDNMGRNAEAVAHHEQAFDLAVRAGNLQAASVGSVNYARNRIFAGNLPAARQALARSEGLLGPYDGAGSHRPMLLMAHALVLCQIGRFDEALARAEAALQSARRCQPGHVPMAHIRLAACWWQLGQWARLAQSLAAVALDNLASSAVQVGHARMRWAYARSTGAALQAVAEARAVLEDTLQRIPDGERPDLRLPLMLELAQAADGELALAQVERARTEAQGLGYANVVLASHVRGAEIAAHHDVRRARQEALAALALQAQGVQTTAMLPGETWLHVAGALARAGDRAHAAEVAAEGEAWLRRAAMDHVPAEFRDSFLERQPVNAALIALSRSLAG